MKTPKILRLIHTFSLITSSKHLLKYAPSTPLHHLISAYPSLPNPNLINFAIHNRHFCSVPSPEIESETYYMLEKKLKTIGIDLANCNIGEKNRLICPECEGGDSMERTFSLYITPDANLAMWQCYRAKCGWRGHVRASEDVKAGFNKFDENVNVKRTRIITEESIGLEPLCNKLVAFFAERMISRETLRRNGVMQKAGSEQVIAFTYRRNGVLVSCKYRDMHKKFWQEKKTEKILYGVDDINDTVDIIIVEGEMDKLSMEEAGFPNCVSVPGGPPCKDSEETPSVEKDTEFQYLWNCQEYLGKASRIILATDADQPGQALAEELARRLGRERCWRVKWPKKSENEVCNDANEVLMHLGSHALHEVIDQAESYPVRGLFKFSDFFNEIDEYYPHSQGYEWKALDGLYKVVPGELTIVTAVPNSGKSEWIDALFSSNKCEGWKFALCSMENKVREHARELLEKHIKKPFFNVG